MTANLNESQLTPRRWAIGAALVTFVFGFGALNLFALSGAGEQNLPGLYTFRSATVGDGLLLPLLAYSLTRSAGIQLGWRRFDKIVIVAAAFAGLGGGITSQVLWLQNPHPHLNWTFPEPYHFNAPGWYHAAFLVVACGFFSGASAAVWLRIRHEASADPVSAETKIRSIGALGVLIPGPAFACLLAMDSIALQGRVTLSAVCPAVAAALLTIVLPCLAVRARLCRWALLAAITSVIPAASLFGIFYPGLKNGGMAALVAGSFGFSGAFVSSTLGHHRQRSLALALIVSICAAAPVNTVTARANVGPMALALGCAASIAIVAVGVILIGFAFRAPSFSISEIARASTAIVPVVGFAASGSYYANLPESNRPYVALVAFIAAGLFLGISASPLRAQFDLVIKAEGTDGSREDLSKAKWTAYISTVAMYSAFTLAFIAFVKGTIPKKDWISGTSGEWTELATLSAALIVGLGVLLTVRHLRNAKGADNKYAITATAVALAWGCAVATQLIQGYGGRLQVEFSVVAALVASLFVFEAVISNMAYLHNLQVDRHVVAVAVSNAFAVTLTVAWMTGPALQARSDTRSLGYGFACLAIGTAACSFIPTLSAASLMGARPARQYVPAAPLAGVLQDSFIATLMIVSAAWVPNLFLAHSRDLSSWSASIAPYLTLLASAYVYVMKNNVGHVARHNRHIGQLAASAGSSIPEDEQRALAGLAEHVGRQNIIASIILLPIGIFALWQVATGFDKGSIVGLFKVSID